eukprot:4605526-Pyramimonas_sp.AAC.1
MRPLLFASSSSSFFLVCPSSSSSSSSSRTAFARTECLNASFQNIVRGLRDRFGERPTQLNSSSSPPLPSSFDCAGVEEAEVEREAN